MHKDITDVLLTAPQIQEKVRELAEKISGDYAHTELTIVAVLKGSIFFCTDLARHLSVPCSFEFISVSSYTGAAPSGVVRLLMDLKESPEGKHVLLVEEIVDTGATLHYLQKNLLTRKPASLRTCVLLDKPAPRKVPVSVDYTGFTVPDKFLVGYGLDYNEAYRNLPYIGVLRQSEI